MMKIIETKLYQCETCGRMYESPEMAKKCCSPCYCEDCGCEIPYNKRLCKSCEDKRDSKHNDELLSKAEHYTLNDAPKERCEMMYSDSFGENDGFFYDIEELREYCKENDIPIPDYVWGTEKHGLYLDAFDIVEENCEELRDDAYDSIANEEIAGLQEYLNEWCSRQSGTDTYFVDYHTAIFLN